MNDLTIKNSAISADVINAAKMLSGAGDALPVAYRNNPGACLMAIEYSNRNGMSIIEVIQNFHPIHGKMAMSGPYAIQLLKNEYPDITYIYTGEGDARTCQASAEGLKERPTVSVSLAKKEGWYTRTGSKWPNMPDEMLRYRVASFTVRANGITPMQTIDEVADERDVTPEPVAPVRASLVDKLFDDIQQVTKTVEPVDVTPEPVDPKNIDAMKADDFIF